MEYRYDIRQFNWKKESSSFYANAPFLVAHLPDGSFHPEAFPSGKGQFIIENSKTRGSNRFTFVNETVSWDTDGEEMYAVTEWLFQSESGINCYIFIDQ